MKCYAVLELGFLRREIIRRNVMCRRKDTSYTVALQTIRLFPLNTLTIGEVFRSIMMTLTLLLEVVNASHTSSTIQQNYYKVGNRT